MCVATSPKDGARTVRGQVFKRKRKILFLGAKNCAPLIALLVVP